MGSPRSSGPFALLTDTGGPSAGRCATRAGDADRLRHGAYQGCTSSFRPDGRVTVAPWCPWAAPVLAAAWEHARARTRPSRRDLAILAAALVGLVLISTASAEGTSDLRPPGAACLRWPGRPMPRRPWPAHPPARSRGGADHLRPRRAPWCCRRSRRGRAHRRARRGDSATSWALLAYLGVATMALAYGLLYAGLRTTTCSAATIATLLEPISAAALAVALLGERIGPAGLVGAALILAAVAGLRARPPVP